MRHIDCKASEPLDFDRVIAAIKGCYPATKITETDWYANRHAAAVTACKFIGMPIPNPPLDCIERVWSERGLQRGFEVPIRDDLRLYARLDKTGGYFFCKSNEFELDDASQLIKILTRFDLALTFDHKSDLDA